MPPQKKQKTGRVQAHQHLRTVRAHQTRTRTMTNAWLKRPREAGKRRNATLVLKAPLPPRFSQSLQLESIPKYEYICVPCELFHFEAKNRAAPRENNLNQEELYAKYVKTFREERASGRVFAPAADNKDWKWVVMCEAWKLFRSYVARSRYCDPDLFGMFIGPDWKEDGLVELLENIVLAFDTAYMNKDDSRLSQMWAIVSALAYGLNEGILYSFLMIDTGRRGPQLTCLLGSALLTALAAIKDSGELKPDSEYLDLPLVISSFLEWASGLPACGIKACWSGPAVAYYTKSGFKSDQGIASTAKRLTHMKEPTTERKGKDPWGWAESLQAYKKHHGVMGGTEYDITKMTRMRRARWAFDRKDSLWDFSEKDIREGLDYVCVDSDGDE